MSKPLRLKPYRYDPDAPPKKPRSEAQKRAHVRTWRIIQLRSLWTLAFWISEPGRTVVRTIIDLDLKAIGAEPHGERVARQRQEQEIPF